jgi:hypothetical protein
MKEFLSNMWLDIVKGIFQVLNKKSVETGIIHRIEVKSITFAYAAFNEILSNDYQAYSNFDQPDKIKLMQLTSDFLSFGILLLPYLKDEALENIIPNFLYISKGSSKINSISNPLIKRDFFDPEFVSPQ